MIMNLSSFKRTVWVRIANEKGLVYHKNSSVEFDWDSDMDYALIEIGSYVKKYNYFSKEYDDYEVIDATVYGLVLSDGLKTIYCQLDSSIKEKSTNISLIDRVETATTTYGRLVLGEFVRRSPKLSFSHA